jgi:hypothetical protein
MSLVMQVFYKVTPGALLPTEKPHRRSGGSNPIFDDDIITVINKGHVVGPNWDQVVIQ